jgi:hypothetical protein
MYSKEQLFWLIGGIYLIIVNITRMIWLMLTENILQMMWLSQIIGTLEGFVFLYRCEKHRLNGFYLAIAPLPFIGFLIYIPIGADLLFYLNHFPHIFLFYFIKHPEKVNLDGFHLSALFMLFIMNFTWWLQYKLDLLGLAINTTTSPFFPIVLLIAIGWYLFCYYYIGVTHTHVHHTLEHKPHVD